MTYSRIEAALHDAIKKKPLYCNQEGLDRLTEAVLEALPKPVVDITVTHASGTLFCAVARVHYE